MENYASDASPPKAAGEQFAEGEAAGARPPLLVDVHGRATPSPKDQSDGELRERREPAEGGGGSGREASAKRAAGGQGQAKAPFPS